MISKVIHIKSSSKEKCNDEPPNAEKCEDVRSKVGIRFRLKVNC